MIQADDLERYMLSLINQERAKVGAPPLQLELNLNASAEMHSLWMLEKDIFSHTGIDGSSSTLRMTSAGFDFSGSWRSAENIAVQTERGSAGIMDDVLNLHTSLMNSAGHSANILNPNLTYIGIGIELGDFQFSSGTFESVIVTQNFGSTQGQVELDNGSTGAEPPAPQPEAEPAAPVATSGNDVLLGTDEVDTIKGLGGADNISGKAGNDRLFGNAGQDTLFGGAGNDTLNGGNGNDTLNGEEGNDKLVGGAGNDLIEGGIGNDRLFGSAGNDMLFGGGGSDTFVFKLGWDVDSIGDFQNDRDRIDLRDFGFSATEEALQFAVQQGGDVLFDFGNGDQLIINDIIIGSLLDDLIV